MRVNHKVRNFVTALVAVVPLLCLIPGGLNADTETPFFSANNTRKTGPLDYVIVGDDPFWTSKKVDIAINTIDGILIKLNCPDAPDALPMQFYWRTHLFDFSEIFSYRFEVPKQELAKGFYLPFIHLPQDQRLMNWRIDIEDCSGCRVHFLSFKIQEKPTADFSSLIPKALKLPQTILPVAETISKKGPWQTHQMQEIKPGLYQINGGDPYIVSPNLNVWSDSIQGILFKLYMENVEKRPMAQFFWETDRQGFSEHNSYFFRLNLHSKTTTFFVPIDAPISSRVLKRVRLDFDRCGKGSVKIVSARLVKKGEAIDADLVPDPMVKLPSNGIRIPLALKQGLHRFFLDGYFAFFYLSLMILVICLLWFVRNGRSSNNKNGDSEASAGLNRELKEQHNSDV